MRELDFKKEHQKFTLSRNDVYKRLLTEASKDTLDLCKKIIDKNADYVYGKSEEYSLVKHRCYNVLFNVLRELTHSSDQLIKRIFNYVSICDTIKMLDDENIKVFETEEDESQLIFFFDENDAMYFSIYDYRLYDYAPPDQKINKLKRIMKDKNFTAASLSNVSGVSIRTIQNYMSGHRSSANAKSEIVSALAIALQVDVSDLI